MMSGHCVDTKRVFLCFIFIYTVKGSVRLNVTSNSEFCPGTSINISCIVDPHTTTVEIVTPNGNDYATSCTAPLPNTSITCTGDNEYETGVTTSGTSVILSLTILSLNKTFHNGIWKCQQSNETSEEMISVKTALAAEKKITTYPLNGGIVSNVTISGNVHCQNSIIKPELLYANYDNQGEKFAVFNLQLHWSITDLGSNGCDSGNNNRTYQTTVTRHMLPLKGKIVRFKIKYNQMNCLSTFVTSSSSAFLFPDPPPDTKARIKTYGSFLSVMEGKSVTLYCEVIGGFPLAKISWNCFNGTVTNKSDDGTARSSITFVISRAQTGHYCTCNASHPITIIEGDSVRISVTYAANITSMVINGNNFTIPEHSTPTITCNAEGSPLPLIRLRFVRNNTVIAKTTGLRLQYTLPYAKCEDTGLYNCEAVNMVTQSHVMKDVNVICYPRSVDITNVDKHVSYMIGETLRISSTYLAYPTPEFNWYFQRTKLSNKTKLINGSENIEIINTFRHKSEVFHQTSFVRKFLKEKDFGLYIITAKNYINSSTNYFFVAVQESPESSHLVGIGLGAGLGSTVLITSVVLTVIFLIRRRKRSQGKDPICENVKGTDSCTYAEEKNPREQKTDIANKNTVLHIVENQESTERSNKHVNPSDVYALVDKTKQTKKGNGSYRVMPSETKIPTDAREKKSPSETTRTKNKDGLIYVDVDIREPKKNQRSSTIHGGDNRTNYAEVDFTKRADPLPPDNDN